MAGGRRLEEFDADTVKVTETGGVDWGRFVDENGAYAAAGSRALGITAGTADEGQYVHVVKIGYVGLQIQTAGTIGKNSELVVGTSGQGVEPTPTSNEISVALAQEVPSADGDKIDVFVDTVRGITAPTQS